MLLIGLHEGSNAQPALAIAAPAAAAAPAAQRPLEPVAGAWRSSASNDGAVLATQRRPPPHPPRLTPPPTSPHPRTHSPAPTSPHPRSPPTHLHVRHVASGHQHAAHARRLRPEASPDAAHRQHQATQRQLTCGAAHGGGGRAEGQRASGMAPAARCAMAPTRPHSLADLRPVGPALAGVMPAEGPSLGGAAAAAAQLAAVWRVATPACQRERSSSQPQLHTPRLRRACGQHVPLAGGAGGVPGAHRVRPHPRQRDARALLQHIAQLACGTVRGRREGSGRPSEGAGQSSEAAGSRQRPRVAAASSPQSSAVSVSWPLAPVRPGPTQMHSMY